MIRRVGESRFRASIVSPSLRLMHNCLKASEAELSSERAKRVPICTPSAPRAIAAIMAWPEAIPPAAMRGSVVALRASGTSTIVVVSSLPLWPPASKPSATTASTPASSHLRANLLLLTTWATLMPASWKRAVYFFGEPAEVNTTGTCSSMTRLAKSSAAGFISGMLTPQGLSVASFILWICSRSRSGGRLPAPSRPRPPALLTAEASRHDEHHTMPPAMMGYLIPNNCVILFSFILFFLC